MSRITSRTRAKLYLAPEAVAGGDEGAARADVFSLGVIAYHILTGRPPSQTRSTCPTGCEKGTACCCQVR